MENNISDVLNQFKDILNKNSNSTSSNSTNSNGSNSLNITPEMITNLAENLKNNNNFNNNLSNNLNSNSTSSDKSNPNQNTEINSSLDINTILKIKNIIESFNQKDDARSNLLYSLKPYLRESIQKKIDQYVNLFKISAITNFFKNEKGDNNYCLIFVFHIFLFQIILDIIILNIIIVW